MIFELRDVSFGYGNMPALRAVNLAIAKGERVALLGANGSGKSTLLRLLKGLAFPDSGELLHRGGPLKEESMNVGEFAMEFHKRVGFVFQNPDVQLFCPTVFEEVAFGPLQMGLSKKDVIDLVNEFLERLQIAHLRDRAPHRLSGGEKKRVAIASVLVLDPEVLLLDEPTASLDPESASHILDHLALDTAGKTIVTATHDLDIVETVARRCIILDRGSVVADGSASEILSQHDLLRRTHLLRMNHHRHPDGVLHFHEYSRMAHRH